MFWRPLWAAGSKRFEDLKMQKAPELFPVESAVVKDYDAGSKQWKEENIKVQIEKRPFACGAMRFLLIS